LGAGGHARSVADVLRRLGGDVVAVAGAPEGPAWDVPVLGSDGEAIELARKAGHAVALGVGSNAARRSLMNGLDDDLAVPVLAASATWAADAVIGAGTVVLEHAHVGPAASLGQAVVVNTAAVVEHDCVIGDAAHLAPAAVVLGGARIGAGALVGSGARVLPGVIVGEGATIGAGAVVREDVPDRQTVVGVPAGPTRS
jgi:sugar O-acyltransferase (sialic acid O-acetyltransferase NeuD family)